MGYAGLGGHGGLGYGGVAVAPVAAVGLGHGGDSEVDYYVSAWINGLGKVY